MPRVLRNYLISFAILGFIFGVVHLLDVYFKSQAEPAISDSPRPSVQSPSAMEEAGCEAPCQ